MAESTFLIIGCGDIGKRVARQLLNNNHKVFATTHSDNSFKTLEQLGITPLFADLDDPKSLQNLTLGYNAIFYFAPPPAKGKTDTRMKNFLQYFLLRQPVSRLVYISTTGVYGDHGQEWIDESTPVSPKAERSMRRLDAETQLQQFAKEHRTEIMIVRVAGIYCLEKLPLTSLKNGKEILARDESGYSNRIHANDLSQVLIAAMTNGKNCEIYNATDGNPSTMADYFIETAKIFSLPPPREVNWEYAQQHFTPGMLSYLSESKRIHNKKITEALNVHLKYPDLHSGLQQCLEEYNATPVNN